MTEASQPLFLFGPGFTGHALAHLWAGKVYGTARTKEKSEILKARGIEPVALSEVAALEQHIEEAHVVISAPPSEAGCPAAALIGAATQRAASVTYLSTTGVYGDRSGGWVFEWSEVSPGSERGHRRVKAEREWRALRPDVKIARLPGIYGPRRSVLNRIARGGAKRIIKPGQVFSRIHVDDLASGLHALIRSPHGGVFHFCDEEAAPPQDVTAFGVELLGLPALPDVPIETAELSAMGASFYAECKRVSNARAKAALGWTPTYPTYRDGLRSIAASDA